MTHVSFRVGSLSLRVSSQQIRNKADIGGYSTGELQGTERDFKGVGPMKRVNEWSDDDVFDKGKEHQHWQVEFCCTDIRLSWIHGFKYIRKVMGKDKGR